MDTYAKARELFRVQTNNELIIRLLTNQDDDVNPSRFAEELIALPRLVESMEKYASVLDALGDE